MTEGNHEKNLNQFGQSWYMNSKLSEYESTVMLCAFKNLSQTELDSRQELE